VPYDDSHLGLHDQGWMALPSMNEQGGEMLFTNVDQPTPLIEQCTITRPGVQNHRRTAPGSQYFDSLSESSPAMLQLQQLSRTPAQATDRETQLARMESLRGFPVARTHHHGRIGLDALSQVPSTNLAPTATGDTFINAFNKQPPHESFQENYRIPLNTPSSLNITRLSRDTAITSDGLINANGSAPRHQPPMSSAAIMPGFGSAVSSNFGTTEAALSQS
jgi:hypothetical protein